MRGEAGAIDHVAAITRQANTRAGLVLGGARLGILAGNAADPDDSFFRALDQHQAHLEQNLQFSGDDPGLAVVETF